MLTQTILYIILYYTIIYYMPLQNKQIYATYIHGTFDLFFFSDETMATRNVRKKDMSTSVMIICRSWVLCNLNCWFVNSDCFIWFVVLFFSFFPRPRSVCEKRRCQTTHIHYILPSPSIFLTTSSHPPSHIVVLIPSSPLRLFLFVFFTPTLITFLELELWLSNYNHTHILPPSI